MSRLAWGLPSERYFEGGVDRGVLYLPGQDGVPWNGITAINEAPSGGEPKPYYVDGYKYLNLASAEDFKATLSAFSAPPEFALCDGMKSIHNGLFATQQPRRPFNLSYRTRVGNIFEGLDHGYKLHLVWSALAAPSTKNNETLGGSIQPLDLSWALTTTPPKVTGIRPTAHFVIDSRLTPPGLMKAIEDILYGSDEANARFPEAQEVVDLFSGPAPIVGRNLAFNPETVDLDGFEEVTGENTLTYVDGAAHFALATSGPVRLPVTQYAGFVEGETYKLLFEVRANRLLRVRPQIKGSLGTTESINEDFHWISDEIVAGGMTAYYTGLAMSSEQPYDDTDWVEIRRVLYSTPDYVGGHFSGATANTPTHSYEWEGPADSSTSIVRSWY